MKKLIAVCLLAVIASADGVQKNSGRVESIRKVAHGGYTHTVVHFTITSAARPIPVVIWLHNDESRLKPGDHVRLVWSKYGTDEGVQHIDQCLETPPEVEPCFLQTIETITKLGDGEY